MDFAGRTYQRRSKATSALLLELFEGLQSERLAVPFTMDDFVREFVKKRFPQLTDEERKDVLQALPPEERLDGLTEGQIRQYLDRLSAYRHNVPHKPRRKRLVRFA